MGKAEGINKQEDYYWFVCLADLEIGCTVYYTVEPDAHPDDLLSFVVSDPAQLPVLAVFGDLGSVQWGGSSGISLNALNYELSRQQYQAVVNLGDIAYEFCGGTANFFMQEMEYISHQVPILPTVGNHEYREAPSGTLHNYFTRFGGVTNGLGKKCSSNSNKFYSVNMGRIHYISLDMEIYGKEIYYHPYLVDGKVQWVKSEEERMKERLRQLKWFQNDLTQIDRKQTPFLVVGGHRPLFQTNKYFMEDIAPLMHIHHVDLYLCGHFHSYVSMESVIHHSFRLPPTVVVGSAGAGKLYSTEKFLYRIQKANFPVCIRTSFKEYGYGYLTATEFELVWQFGKSACCDVNAANDPVALDQWEKIDEWRIPKHKFD